MPDRDFEYDAFLSYAREDIRWCEELAERLRDANVRVWFDKWEIQAGDQLERKLNEGLEKSRKLISVWSASYFREGKVWPLLEAFSRHHSDPLSQERPLIPALIEPREKLKIPPTLQGIIDIDFCKKDDFELRLRELIESLDLPRKEFAQEEIDFREHDLDPSRRGRVSYKKGKRFEEEVATLYNLLGFEVKTDVQLGGMQIDLVIEQKVGGLTIQAIVECKDKRITANERDQILAQQNVVQKKHPAYRWIAVSSQGFAADTRTALEEAGVSCVTYAELLRELVPLDRYVEGLISEYEAWRDDRWKGEDWFVRPDLITDITYEKRAALAHFSKWLGDERTNFLVVLGDLGTGKSTLAGFLSYNLARSFRDDPVRHPAPVLIPLKDVRKELSLEGIIISHFGSRGLPDVSFTRFMHLARRGKIIIFFDAFDEMADRVRWEVTQGNFRELRRAADFDGKVILTCRTHYFKDRDEQVRVIGEGPKLSEIETELYRELKKQSGAEVVYLQEFDDDQIRAYLKKARPDSVEEDWRKIKDIHNLKDLAQRPLLLEMIVKSLSRLDAGQQINAANLYSVYTNIWVDRDEEEKGRFLDKNIKLALMFELAWKMWNEGKTEIHYLDLMPFLKQAAPEKIGHIADDEVVDIAREIQTASFLKRVDDAGNFAFMHRSFMEFFLARKLFECLTDSDNEAKAPEVLNTLRFDRKVIYFLTLLDEGDKIREPLQRILKGNYLANVSENALQILYWSGRVREQAEEKITEEKLPDPLALRKAMAGRIPAGARLAGARLQEIVLEAADLTGADFSNADLTEANLNHARLVGANFRKAKLVNARIDSALAERSDFREADLTGASLNETDLTRSRFIDAIFEPSAFISARLQGVEGLAASATIHLDRLRAMVQRGHASTVNAVAYSPDGELIASGGADGLILIYRAIDGHIVAALEGHSSYVRS
ncbi:MAG: TIR domain-containing protein, partial [Blastocatellia bacterium]|nr:TIR domain-containing protein [Blastocatellia bacterium]